MAGAHWLAVARFATCHLNSQFRRYRRWAKSGVFEGLFKAVSEDPDSKYTLIDGTIVGLHQKATGSKGASASG